MEKMNNFDNKMLKFATALKDVYREPEDRQLESLGRLKLTEDSLTEDFTAMFHALYFLYGTITGDEVDVFEFVGIVNRLCVQHLLEKEEIKTK